MSVHHKIATRKLTGYSNIHHMRQMMLEALHSLRQFRGIGIWGGEHGFEWEGNDVWHVGMKNWMKKSVCLYTKRPCCPSPKPHSGTNSYWPSHHNEKSNSAPLQKNFFQIIYSGTDSGPYTKNFSHSTWESQRPLRIKGPQLLLQPPYHLPITDALTNDMVIILALAHCHICHAPDRKSVV